MLKGISLRSGLTGLFCSYFILNVIQSNAQGEVLVDDVDTIYVKDLSHLAIGRLYSSTKYNEIRLAAKNGGRSLVYRPTNQFNIGIGASYRKFTFNLGVGIPVLTRERRAELGHSRYLDAQANLLSAQRATNLFLQFFKGYRLISHSAGDAGWRGENDDPAKFRDDIEQFNFGISTLKVHNSERFSYRATMFHDARQKVSQGSWLSGAYFGYYRLRADSSLVPTALLNSFASAAAMKRGDLLDLGPMGGYAYTLVIDERFFVMGSLALGAGMSMQYRESATEPELTTNSSTIWGPGWRAQVRGGIGYNGHRDQIVLSINHEQVNYLMPLQSMFSWGVGNIRFNIVHRFNKGIEPVDRWLSRLKPRTHPIIHEMVPAIKEAKEQP